MNAHDRDMGAAEDLAILHYSDGEYAVLKPGRYVLCAVTGARIPLDRLRYWNPIAQEAYLGPEQALAAWRAGGSRER